MTANKMYQGSCLCGGIRYEIHGEIGEIIQCHCQRCRKSNGSAFATNAPVKKTEFKFVQGEHLLKFFSSSEGVERGFCMQCGSPIIANKSSAPEYYRLRLGTLDTPVEHKPRYHVFTSHKAEWDQICDDLKQFPEWPE